MVVVAAVVGCVESLTARLPMSWVPIYVLLASAFSLLAMALVGLEAGGP
jgi:hypothetical protein